VETLALEHAPGPVRMRDARLDLAIDYIHAHYAEPLTIAEIARAAGVASGYFTRFFKAIAGVPPRAYLTEVRFERAKVLIRSTSKSMTQIAADCGFADQSHMTNVFRKRVGMTPTEFRSA
jgi:AraC family transcriptional regulator